MEEFCVNFGLENKLNIVFKWALGGLRAAQGQLTPVAESSRCGFLQSDLRSSTLYIN